MIDTMADEILAVQGAGLQQQVNLVLSEYSGLNTRWVYTYPQITTRILFDRLLYQLHVNCQNFPVCTENDITHKQHTKYHAVYMQTADGKCRPVNKTTYDWTY